MPDAALASAPVSLDGDVHDRLHRPRAARDARRAGGLGRRPPDGLDRDAAALRGARGAGRGARRARGGRARRRARHGGGFGGKHAGEVAQAAARLARAAGRPVKVRWSREEEFRRGYLRPAAVIDVRSGAGRGRRDHGLGDAQHELGHVRPRRAVRDPEPAARLPAGRLSAARRAPTGRWPRPPTTSPASRTWTSWRTPSGLDPLALRLRHLRDERLAAVSAGGRRADRLGRPFAHGRPRHRPRRRRREGRPGRHRRGGAGRPGSAPRDRADRDRLRVRRDRQPGRPGEPGRGRDGHGPRGGPVRGDPLRGGSDHERVAVGLPRPAVHGRAADRGDPPRPARPALGRRRRDADHRHRPGPRQRDLRRDRRPAPLAAARARRPRSEPG